VIIVGGSNSSNTQKLYEISKKNCKEVFFIQTKKDLDIEYIKEFDKIGVMAGASTPMYIVDEVINSIVS
jgi:4-hydroxy-3-methylbut-2-enyl diphosphate reductase IspH